MPRTKLYQRVNEGTGQPGENERLFLGALNDELQEMERRLDEIDAWRRRVGAYGDVTTRNHGLAPLAPGDKKMYLRGDGAWAYLPQSVMGEVSFTTNATVTTLTTTQTWTRVAIASSLNVDMEFDSPSNSRLRYIGGETKMMHCGCTISFKPAGASDTFKFCLYKNGGVNGSDEYINGTALTQGTVTLLARNAAEHRSTAIHVMTMLRKNEYLELAVWNDTDADDLVVTDMNIFAVGMGS